MIQEHRNLRIIRIFLPRDTDMFNFATQKKQESFHKIPDFSCSRCIKRVFNRAFVWKCINMCIVQAPFWSPVVAESIVM
jgi:hypothetical protein